jgi:hypothetical protein
VAGGNQVNAPVTAPVTVGGNAVAVLDEATVEDTTSPGMPGDGAGTSDPSTEPTLPGAGSGAPGNGQPSDDGQEAQDVAGGSTSDDSVVAAELTAAAGVPVLAASAIPTLARTGFAGEVIFLGLLALMAGLGLLVASRRSGSPTRR